MTQADILTVLTAIQRAGVELHADGARLYYRAPVGALTSELRAVIAPHKTALVQLLSAPAADVLSEEPCHVCGSHERWQWVDGRALCRVCLILDLAPLTLTRAN
jgi:hypothetical protein